MHATLFAVMALFRMGCAKEAWEQLIKVLPFTDLHANLSHSPFVMPNSYGLNEEKFIDGQNMNDWQTGSANVLLKLLVRYVFGFEPALEGAWIQPAAGLVPLVRVQGSRARAQCPHRLSRQSRGNASSPSASREARVAAPDPRRAAKLDPARGAPDRTVDDRVTDGHTCCWSARRTSTWHNLAVEEYLLDTRGDREGALFLWQSGNAVVIGKNRNPWRDAGWRISSARAASWRGGLSGGGAVYHDAGNLNFAFIQPRVSYSREACFDCVRRVLSSLGVEAEVMEHNSLGVGGRKFSGNAFCFRKGAAMHHGTLLVRSDLDLLGRVLGPSLDGIRSRAVPSHPAPVVNLAEIRDSITVESLSDAFVRELGGGGRVRMADAAELGRADVAALAQRHASWDWRFGATPAFDAVLNSNLGGGPLSLLLHVVGG